jgi:ribosome-binding factor A
MTRRIERVDSLLVEVIAEIVMREIKDPRLPGLITITKVETTQDLRQATVFFSLLGTQEAKKLALKLLQAASGFITMTASKKVTLRFFPKLTFKLDDTLEKHQRIDELLKKIDDEKNLRSS